MKKELTLKSFDRNMSNQKLIKYANSYDFDELVDIDYLIKLLADGLAKQVRINND